jgi:hypothetical protein
MQNVTVVSRLKVHVLSNGANCYGVNLILCTENGWAFQGISACICIQPAFSAYRTDLELTGKSSVPLVHRKSVKF